jgi:hypothetical protein
VYADWELVPREPAGGIMVVDEVVEEAEAESVEAGVLLSMDAEGAW